MDEAVSIDSQLQFDRRFRLEDERLLTPGDPRFRWSMLDGDLQYSLF